MATIHFFAQDISFKIRKPRKTKEWIRDIIRMENRKLNHLNYIFCSDAYLLSLNEQYLKHKTLTDIITFDISGSAGVIEGDIFISVERVRANSLELEVPFDEELLRVLIHGVLHLIGYRDKTSSDKLAMREKEDACLSLQSKP